MFLTGYTEMSLHTIITSKSSGSSVEGDTFLGRLDNQAKIIVTRASAEPVQRKS